MRICGFVVNTGCQIIVLDRNVDIDISEISHVNLRAGWKELTKLGADPEFSEKGFGQTSAYII